MIVQGVKSNLLLLEAKPEFVKWHLILQPKLPFCPRMTEKDSTSNPHLHMGTVITVNQRVDTSSWLPALNTSQNVRQLVERNYSSAGWLMI